MTDYHRQFNLPTVGEFIMHEFIEPGYTTIADIVKASSGTLFLDDMHNLIDGTFALKVDDACILGKILDLSPEALLGIQINYEVYHELAQYPLFYASLKPVKPNKTKLCQECGDEHN